MNIDFGFIEQSKRTDPLYIRFQTALRQFLQRIDLTATEAILVCGSFAKNRLTNNSDIDVVVVLPDESSDSEAFKEVTHNGIPFQLFKFTKKELLDNFNWERQGLIRQRSSLVSSGIVILGKTEVGNDLIEKARESFNSPIAPVSLENARSMINFIEGQFPQNMDKLYASSKYGYMFTVNGMMDKYFTLLHQMYSKPLPREKEIDAELSSIPDLECGRLFCGVLVEEDSTKKRHHFFELSKLIVVRLKDYIKENYEGRAF